MPNPDNIGNSYATGLASEVALVVGHAPFGSPYTDERGFLWTPIDAYGDAGAPGISATRAYAVSSNGSFIVGSYSLLGINRHFYSGNGDPRDLGMPP